MGLKEIINTCGRCGLLTFIFTAGIAYWHYKTGILWTAFDQFEAIFRPTTEE
jgi:hypothetical protein